MEYFFENLGSITLIAIILYICIFLFIIYCVWSFIKSAIAKGVEIGIYNAIIALENRGIINDILTEAEEIKQLYNPNIKPTENDSEN